MTGPPTVRILCDGWLVREGGVVTDASSTVTMLETDVGIVLVDTGSRSCADKLWEALSAIGTRKKDVSYVVNTHLHMDHCGANDMFPDAVFYAHGLEDPPIGTRKVSSETRLAHGVRIVPTPGHTRGSVSVFVESDRRYAVCGDAIPTKANYDAHLPPAVHFDRAVALLSMDVILGWARTVVPGHDPAFDILGKT